MVFKKEQNSEQHSIRYIYILAICQQHVRVLDMGIERPKPLLQNNLEIDTTIKRLKTSSKRCKMISETQNNNKLIKIYHKETQSICKVIQNDHNQT